MIGIFGLLLVAMFLVVKFCKKTLKLVLSILRKEIKEIN